MKVFKFLFYTFGLLIIWPMVGYKFLMIVLNMIVKDKHNHNLDESMSHSATIIVAAHNEEKVIEKKLQNLQELEYDESKLAIIIASDNSDDDTNNIVERFIEESELKYPVQLYNVQERRGKTNAQNEAVKLTNSDILVFTDANSLLDRRAVLEISKSFTDSNISYVTGRLIYTNDLSNSTSRNEAFYWNLDLQVREAESKLSSVTAGNGAIYGIRSSEYIDFPDINSHDGTYPKHAVMNGKRAVYNKYALAFEKAGETEADEYKRKVRMNRALVENIIDTRSFINILKYGWFSLFYVSHRTLRYMLSLNHAFLYITNILLINNSKKFKLFFILQTIFYVVAILEKYLRTGNRITSLVYYYCITLVAQLHGFLNYFTKRSKATWDKAETTR